MHIKILSNDVFSLFFLRFCVGIEQKREEKKNEFNLIFKVKFGYDRRWKHF